MKSKATLLLAGFLACFVAPTAYGQSQEELSRKLEAKLAESWFTDYGWLSDYDKAREQAKESGKLILTYFTRSYYP
jgi:hypothetical protein